jgi:hypothetical protein
MLMKWRRFFLNCLLMTVTIIICLFAAEFVIRMWMGDKICLYPRFHTRAEYGPFIIRRLRPNTTFSHRSIDGQWQFATNRNGFRYRKDVDYAKATGLMRALCVGDSHTQGFEVRQDRTYAAVAETYLNERGLKSEIINAGVSGFGTAEELVFIEYEAIRYSPDFVVIGFCANDFDDNLKSDLFRYSNNVLITNKFIYAPGVKILDILNNNPVIRLLSQNSYLYSTVFNSIWEYSKGKLLANEQSRSATELAIKQEDITPAVFEYECALTVKLVEKIYQVCKAKGIKLIILDLPILNKDDPASFKSSIPAALMQDFRQHSDMLIGSADVLADYRGIAEVFVPHGQRHISETTHMLYGIAVAKTIMNSAPAFAP